MKIKLLHFLIILTGLITACVNTPIPAQGPAGYAWTEAGKYYLPDILLEVSGIEVANAAGDSLFAQQDEAGRLFLMRTGEKKYQDFRFGNDGDYEDLSIWNRDIFMLRSDGVLFEFPLDAFRNNDRNAVKEWKGNWPNGEYEGLFADSSSGILYLMCKECEDSRKDILIRKLERRADSSIGLTGEIRISESELMAKTDQKKLRGKQLQPSALAKHPITKEWFILSHANKLLIVTDSAWQVRSVTELSPTRFRQPEGIAFAANGDMYISNEGDEVSSGNILKFTYQTSNSSR